MADPRGEMLMVLTEKMSQMAVQVKGTNIDFSDKDDKAFDRTMKTMLSFKELSETFKFLRNEIGIAQEKAGEGRGYKNPIEASAKRFSIGKGQGGGADENEPEF